MALPLLTKGKGYLKSSQTVHRERKAFGSSDEFAPDAFRYYWF